MRDLVSCFNENAVNISRSTCSSYSRPPCISPNLTFSTQNSVTCLYKIILSTQRQLFVAVTWCKNISSQGLSMNFAQSFKPNSNSVIFKKKKGSKVYESDNAKLEVIWDLSNANYDSGTEPKDGFYVLVLVDSEIALVLGKTAEEELKKRFLSADFSAKVSLISRREEHSSGHTLYYSTKAQFSNAGTKHDISIRFTEETEGSNHPGLLVRIDQKTAICVKRLQWNFRGSQTIFVDGLLVDLFWNVHDWLFRTVDGYAVFMFRARNGEDSRSQKEEDAKNEEECVEFSLLISSTLDSSVSQKSRSTTLRLHKWPTKCEP